MPAMIMLQLASLKLTSPTQMTSPASMQKLLRASLLFAVGAALAVEVWPGSLDVGEGVAERLDGGSGEVLSLIHI